MKKFKWLAAALVLGTPALAQDFPGYRVGNYTGVNGVFFNPANIADSRYKFDFNLFSLNTSLGNSNAAFKLKDLGNSFDEDSIKTQLFGDKAGPASGLLSVNLVGPSLMFNTGRKMSFALTTRARAMVNIKDIDGKLANKLIDDVSNDADLPYDIMSDQNMAVSANGWTEFGLSVGRVLADKGKHFLKGGITLKYLAGAANSHLYINKLKATLNEDAVTEDYYLTEGSGTLGVGFGGVQLFNDDFNADDLLAFKSTGFGGDIGFVYEFRPDESIQSREANKYKLRVGVALLDIGTIKYERDLARSGAYNINIAGAEKFYLSELDDVELDDYKSTLDGLPQYFTPTSDNGASDIKVSLPTTLQVDVDYHIHRGFYINAAGQFSLSKMENKPFNNQYYNGFTATPRFEGRAFGIYVPVNYNELTKLNAGVSVRMGPLFVGSGSVLTAIMSDSKQADIHLGLHIGILQKKDKKPKKTKKAKNETTVTVEGN